MNGHRVVFLDNITSTNTTYEFAIGVFDEANGRPALVVTERSTVPRAFFT